MWFATLGWREFSLKINILTCFPGGGSEIQPNIGAHYLSFKNRELDKPEHRTYRRMYRSLGAMNPHSCCVFPLNTPPQDCNGKKDEEPLKAPGGF